MNGLTSFPYLEREVLGMEVGTSEAEPIWTEFLRRLTRRGLRGVKLVVSDAHEGLKAAVTKVLSATWQRCRVHFMRNVLAHAGKSGRRVVSAFIATAFAQETPEAASAQWRSVADQIRPKVPKLATIMDNAEEDVLAYMTFPKEHRAKLHSTNPIERLNGEIKRRTEVVGIFPNDEAIVRLVGALLLEQNDEWAVQRARYLTLETMAQAMIRKSVCPLWPADIPPALCRKARPSAATYTTSRDTIRGFPRPRSTKSHEHRSQFLMRARSSLRNNDSVASATRTRIKANPHCSADAVQRKHSSTLLRLAPQSAVLICLSTFDRSYEGHSEPACSAMRQTCNVSRNARREPRASSAASGTVSASRASCLPSSPVKRLVAAHHRRAAL
jgi:hypothetical protein